MRRVLSILLGRRAAVCWLTFGAVGSIVLACLGAEQSLMKMKTLGAMTILAVAAVACFAACMGTRRVSVWLLHTGLALVLGGWVYDAWKHQCGDVPEDCVLWLAEPVSRGETGWTFTMGDEQRGYYNRVWYLPGPAPANAVGWEYVHNAYSAQHGFMRWTTNTVTESTRLIPCEYLSADAEGPHDLYPEGEFRNTVATWFNTNLQANNHWYPTRVGFKQMMNQLSARLHPDGRMETNGVALALKDFRIQVWEETGTVRSYESDVTFSDGRPGETISVNHPLRMGDGWWVYQQSWDRALGRGFIWSLVNQPERPEALSEYFQWSGRRCVTGLLCVKDVGLPFVFVGGLLLILGAAIYLVESFKKTYVPKVERGKMVLARLLARILFGACFIGGLAMVIHRCVATGHAPMQNMYEFLMCTAVLIPVLTYASWKFDHQETLLVDAFLLVLVMVPVGFVMDGSVRKLMPALQSPFFIPHVGAYVLGYILLVRAALGAGRRLVGLGFFLLTLGLVLGAAWGKVCWGHWWQFDPKEMWSAATWLTYAAYFHVRARLSPRADWWFLIVGAMMIVLTLTWVNLSRLFPGMHSYA